MARAADTVKEVTAASSLPVVGYCFGGTLALLREATRPSGDPLGLIAPVVDTTADAVAGRGMGVVLAHRSFHPSLALDERGMVPGPFVRESFHWMRPKALQTVRTWRATRRDPDLAAGYAAMARWVWQHQTLPGGVLFDAVALYRRGGLGVPLDRVEGPVLVVSASATTSCRPRPRRLSPGCRARA